MVVRKTTLVAAVLFLGILSLACSVAASDGIRASFGDEIPLSGYSTAGPYVYLFLTGPNLPENGVALNGIYQRADQGFFTKVSVGGDDLWSYTWHTGSIGGRLDTGTYTIWVVNGPNDRSNLAHADYRTISVTLGKPAITVDTPAQPGAMEIRSVPDNASVLVGGDYRGMTPLDLSPLTPGFYEVTFSRFGYMAQTVRVQVQPGRVSEVLATLQPATGSLSVNSTPAGARVLLDGAFAGLSPVVLPGIPADNHTVTLETEGYQPATRQLRVEAGQTSTVDISLEPVPVPVTTTRSPGLVLSTAGALVVAIAGLVYRGRNR
jgi:hypothetical protein